MPPFNTLASLLALGLALTPFGADARLEIRATPGSKGVIAQLFEWNWDSVAQECTNFLGPQGYGYVQGMCSISSFAAVDAR